MSDSATATANFKFFNYEPQLSDIRTDALEGLRQSPRELPPKLLYDERGSQLFINIVKQPEYYLPGIESAILSKAMPQIAQQLGDQPLRVIEPGAGDCRKIRDLIDGSLNVAAYVPLEIEPEIVKQTAGRLAADYPEVNVYAVCADYMNLDALPEDIFNNGYSSLIYFPGSSIGNYDPKQAVAVLKKLRELSRGGALLIGIDTQKDSATLEAAYADAAGVTAAFNMNLLVRLKRELQAELEVDAFKHKSIYNTELGRIEMHLVAQRETAIIIGDERFEFQPGETIHTENSYKYKPDSFRQMGFDIGYDHHEVFMDEREFFSMHLFW